MSKLSKKEYLTVIVIILHVVGIVGTLTPQFKDIFLSLTPVNLLITCAILIISHEAYSTRLVLALSICFILGVSIEIIGVQTGWPFGEYSYGKTLGWKVVDVPLIIGINWFILSYCFYSLSSLISSKLILQATIASLAMVLLDILIEPVAISLNYWSWELSHIPVENYIAWFIISLVLQLILHRVKSKGSQTVCLAIIGSQTLYFASIFLLKL